MPAPLSPAPSPFTLLGVVGACLLALLGWRLGNADEPVSRVPPATISEAAPASATVTVHVVGLVARPGLVTLPEGARLADAVVAAGGLRKGADAASVNLAAPVVDGQQIVIGAGVETAVGGDDAMLSLNTATAAELEALPGVGPVLAGRIVSHRESNGPFGAVEDLLAVSGIGERMLASIRDLVRP